MAKFYYDKYQDDSIFISRTDNYYGPTPTYYGDDTIVFGFRKDGNTKFVTTLEDYLENTNKSDITSCFLPYRQLAGDGDAIRYGLGDSKHPPISIARASDGRISIGYLVTLRKGKYIGRIIAEEGIYPDDGPVDGIWYVKGDLANAAPTISGTDQDLGGKASPFNFTYTVDDKDTTQELTITEKLNGTTLRTISNALRNTQYQVEITEDRFSKLTLNAENTIEISVSDGQGATAYRRLKFRRTNSPPTISITNRELGEQNEPFSFTFTVNDLENDVVRLEFINGGKIIGTMEDVTLGEEITYTFDKVTFAQLFNGNQEIVIRAIDINNAASADRVYFNKAVAGAGYIHRYQSDVLCDYVIVWDEIDLADGEEKKLQVCNNFNDDNPAWEDAPFNDVHKFANTTVVNAPDVGVRIEVLDNPNTGNSYINSFMVKAGVISGS